MFSPLKKDWFNLYEGRPFRFAAGAKTAEEFNRAVNCGLFNWGNPRLPLFHSRCHIARPLVLYL